RRPQITGKVSLFTTNSGSMQYLTLVEQRKAWSPMIFYVRAMHSLRKKTRVSLIVVLLVYFSTLSISSESPGVARFKLTTHRSISASVSSSVSPVKTVRYSELSSIVEEY
ncbi:MAG TPA: hypothetical protein VJU54_04600, partial [Nitrospiraceae bacterium]|nr:hypothetical protein [Nitrospiraceae bacterium]